mmetsp:Transcript_49121/g.96846  ORF Transcript_49121/g.96846 Transcript_49121/m.96846 type:complete len:154 (-) Transcript_49121:1818-2279(-)
MHLCAKQSEQIREKEERGPLARSFGKVQPPALSLTLSLHIQQISLQLCTFDLKRQKQKETNSLTVKTNEFIQYSSKQSFFIHQQVCFLSSCSRPLSIFWLLGGGFLLHAAAAPSFSAKAKKVLVTRESLTAFFAFWKASEELFLCRDSHVSTN